MENAKNEIVTIIIEKLKTSKFLWLLIALYLLFYVKQTNSIVFKKLLDLFTDSARVVITDIVPILVLSVMVICIFALLRYSDKVWHEKFDERELAFESYDSESVNPFKIRIFENTKYTFRHVGYRDVTLYNNSDSELIFVKGQVDFYSNKVRVLSYPFEISKLKPSRGHKILRADLERYLHEWNEFDFYIENCVFKDEQLGIVEQRFKGVSFARIPSNLNYILNRKWYEKLIPYNILWLKEFSRERLLHPLKWHFTVQRVWEREITELTRQDRRKNLLRIILTIPFAIVIGVLFVWVLIHSAYTLINLLKLWISFFISLVL